MVQVSPDACRILILGNSGSGKSTLAGRLAAERGLEHLDLDTVAWLPTDPPQRRPLPASGSDLEAFTEANQRWVVEGCYADLMELLADRADALVFLDRSIERCQAHARARPFEPHKYPSKEAQDANLPMLLDWIAAYPDREGAMGRPEHARIYEGFPGWKLRVR